MFLQKVRAFFEWMGKRSAAKSRKVLDYEWTTMRPQGQAPVKTVDLGENSGSARPAPVKTVNIDEPCDVPAAPASVEKQSADVEKKMNAALKSLTIRDALETLAGVFEEAGSVRRSRVALLAFLQEKPEALELLEAKARDKKSARAKEKAAAKSPAAKKNATRKAAGKTVVRKSAAANKRSASTKVDASVVREE